MCIVEMTQVFFMVHTSSRENASGLMPAATPSCGAGLFWCFIFERDVTMPVARPVMMINTPKK